MKVALLITVLIFTSCTLSVKSPVTQIEYTGAISEDGISLSLIPPFWKWAVDFYYLL